MKEQNHFKLFDGDLLVSDHFDLNDEIVKLRGTYGEKVQITI